MQKRNPQVDGYIRKNKQWQAELEKLRTILLDSELVEEVKWYHPCYTFRGANVAILGGFKEYCAMSFMKGALLKDAKGILVRPGENSQATRTLKVRNVSEIEKIAATLKRYVKEAIEIEKAGLKVKLKDVTEHAVPEEFRIKLEASPKLKAAFESLTPGRRRGYLLHFGQAKQSSTRAARVEKWTQHILNGKGLDD